MRHKFTYKDAIRLTLFALYFFPWLTALVLNTLFEYFSMFFKWLARMAELLLDKIADIV